MFIGLNDTQIYKATPVILPCRAIQAVTLSIKMTFWTNMNIAQITEIL